ncbi:hypothetical protein C7999DRAFT_42573 [Corynascus novoguineensis]|uniref:Secreted protein n=1 Tax=Corynascus novoguineensis TaxID=1126955 RepID=A0AAN7CQ35_9PEZI|nr:hypothetical protein C7999DRAFT_42573 [Corynascus novoguineensis]
MTKFLIVTLLSFVSVQSVLAAPKVCPEVTPGSGMPSLAELNVTSAQLYEMGRPTELDARDLDLGKRFDGNCGPAEDAYTNVDDIIACYHYLNKLGNKMCTTDYSTIICKAGKAHVRGSALHGSTSSYCRHVANAVLWVVDHCTRSDKSCAGNAMATGNGDFLVSSMSNEW